jgi:hypothetical protein
MRSSTLICLVGSLVSLGSGAWAQDTGDGTGYFRGPAASVVTGDGTGYFRGVTPTAPPPPRAPVANTYSALMPYGNQVYWPFVFPFPRWSWFASSMMGSRLFPYGYGTPRAPLYGMRGFLDAPMHRRSAR